eukprot:2540826-Prymnesium_polylepis.1
MNVCQSNPGTAVRSKTGLSRDQQEHARHARACRLSRSRAQPATAYRSRTVHAYTARAHARVGSDGAIWRAADPKVSE